MSDKNRILKLGIPSGSLQASTLELFSRAGFNIRVPSRSYSPTIDDDTIEAVMFRAQEMSRYVEDGVLDAGLTGIDWVLENASDVVEVAELIYSKATAKPARWVLVVPPSPKSLSRRTSKAESSPPSWSTAPANTSSKRK